MMPAIAILVLQLANLLLWSVTILILAILNRVLQVTELVL
jgi:hypothetical protein